jgi:trans-aconitate methyltransferase
MSDPYANTGLDASTMHPARRYDYLLGGKDNFKIDRISAEALVAANPRVKTGVRENRRCLARMVAELANAHGIRQFLDIGTGIPTSPNTHEVAQRIAREARVVYVDNDPLVMVHARALLTSDPHGATEYIQADLRRPQDILSAPQLRATLDLTQPVALMCVAVLHFLPDDEAILAALGTMLDALAAGSMLAVTHASYDWMPELERAVLEEELQKAVHGTTKMRSHAELETLIQQLGLELMEPGLVSTIDWHPGGEPHPEIGVTAADAMCWAALARRP